MAALAGRGRITVVVGSATWRSAELGPRSFGRTFARPRQTPSRIRVGLTVANGLLRTAVPRVASTILCLCLLARVS